MKNKKSLKMKWLHYQCDIEFQEKYGVQKLGLMTTHTWLTDPKRLLFMLSRYKFIAKMFSGLDSVLEIGCGDGFCTAIVSKEVKALTAVDFEPIYIQDIRKKIIKPFISFKYFVHDILKSAVPGKFDGIYSLDVIEHIPKENENLFLANMIRSLKPEGTIIIGTPSIQSQAYASQVSKDGHVNCKDHAQLKKLMLKYFHNVFIFSMNDEVIHTGFYPMAHYLIALCCNKK